MGLGGPSPFLRHAWRRGSTCPTRRALKLPATFLEPEVGVKQAPRVSVWMLLLGLGLPGCTEIADPILGGVSLARSSLGTEKVTICHKGQTITVGAPAVPAHLAHGDLVGPCNSCGTFTLEGVAGLYNAVTYNGNTLPYYFEEDGNVLGVIAGSIVLSADGTFSASLTISVNGVEMQSDPSHGTYALEEPSTIVLHIAEPWNEDNPGTIEGCKITIALDPPNPDWWEFVKQ